MQQEYILTFIIVILLCVFISKSRKKEGLIDQPLNLLPVLKPPPNYKYVYYPMQDSPGNNIRQNAFQEGNIDALKKSCDGYHNCVGFNSDGWLKYQILPTKQWKAWGINPKKGLYVKRPL